MPTSNTLIEINQYQKKYGKELILSINHFEFLRGTSYLLIGGNGSGKSTLIKSILGFLKYDGLISIDTDSIAYLPERIQKIDFLTIGEYLDIVLDLNQKPIREEILNQLFQKFGLSKDVKVTSCSKGMFQKMNIILTFILDRDLIILDEPLNGLDKKTQDDFVGLINNEKKKGKTFIISTHYPSIYEHAYDKIIRIMNKTITVEEA